MNKEHLLSLFPDSIFLNSPALGKEYFSLPFEDTWLHIPKEKISKREEKLLLYFLSPETEAAEQPFKNPWAAFLFGNTTKKPAGYSKIQFLQFQIKFGKTDHHSFNRSIWLDAFGSSLPDVQDSFFIAEDYGLFVLKNDDNQTLSEDVSQILNTLDDDFSIQTRIYIGQNWEVDDHLPTIFEEEKNIFEESRLVAKGNRVLTLAEVALVHYTRDATAKSSILTNLKKMIASVEESDVLIQAMWHTQGNISRAAQELYVHRNTLQYRIDRFFQTTGLSLKTMDDLLLCYITLNIPN